jgi:hypothetical protein
MTIIAHVDWFSTSLACDFGDEALISGVPQGGREAATTFVAVLPPSLLGLHSPQPVAPRAPYRYAYQCENSAARYSWHPDGDHVHIELPGRACLTAEKEGDLFETLKAYGKLATRIDIACDIQTKTQPSVFCSAGYSRRFSSYSIFSSDSGETVYVGSMSSERFARVYRYNPPHPRSHLLRIEYVFRKEYAPGVIDLLLREGYRGFLRSITDVFRWVHADWDINLWEGAAAALSRGYVPERHASRTLLWLETVCCPAIVRLTESGEIRNLEAWLDENLRTRLNGRGH